MTIKRLFHMLILALLLLSSCNLPSNRPDEQGPPETPQEISAPEATPTETSTETPIPFTATPEFTSTPEFTPTPTIPLASVSVNTNCRTGPGTQYDLIGGLNVGQTAEVVGKSTITNYWIIKTPGGSGVCWLWGQYATVSGNTTNLPEYSIPPTPTPSIPAPVQNLNAGVSCVLKSLPFLINEVTVNLTWSDASTNEEGFRVFRGGSLLATLPANTSGYTDNTTLPAIWLVGDPPPSITYDIRSFNGAGASNKVSVTVQCP